MADVLPDQATIEMPNGVTFTGMGGDGDAFREQVEERHEELGKTVDVAPATAEKPKPVRKRLDELTFQREEANRRAEAAEAKIKELEAKIAAPAVAKPADAPVTVPETVVRAKPAETEVGTKYPSYSDYVEDLADWKAEQREMKFRQELEARSTASIEADRASRTIAASASDAFTRGRAAYPDFDAVLKAADGVIIPMEYQKAILKLPNPEHAMYGLAQDQTKLKAILNITDGVQLGMELAQFMPRETGASPAPPALVVRTTNAPAPTQPVGSGSRTTRPSLQELADSGNYDAYKKARAAGQLE